MKKVACVIIFWLTASLLIGGCSRDAGEDAGEVLVNLNISVALSDVAQSMARGIEEDAGAMGNNEKMQTLRVIVVRPDGTVEYNESISLRNVLYYEGNVLQVVGNEIKKIYFFVNEETELDVVKADGTRLDKNLAGYFNEIKRESKFPETEISDLMIHLDEGKQLTGALPMNECHEIKVDDKDKTCNLFVTRAAVKFTFRITNNSSVDGKLTGLTIKNMANKEYYLPRNANYENENIEGKEYLTIKSFDIPPSVEGYDYRDENLSVSLPMMEGGDNSTPTELGPIYLLEGKQESGYFVGITVNGVYLEGKLDKLPYGLPRNTHVVVNIKITDKELEFEVDVEPYREVKLEPGFGL